MRDHLEYWKNLTKDDKGDSDHKSKCEHKNSCGSCGHHDKSACDCNFRSIKKVPKLNSDCILVNSVVGSKMVQKVAEITLPALDFGVVDIANIVSIAVVPNLAGITHNVRVIRDKVVNIGLIPVTITITVLDGGVPVVLPLITTSIPFQEHTDFPGACPEDIVTESPFVVEGIFNQPGVPIIDAGLITLTGILIKVVLRTTITVTRPVIVDSHGGICDANDRRCESPTTPPTFTFPAPPTTGGL
ncbi:hypothetical protein J7E52_14545 [Bacillus sp. ISL-34]|uniref:hypothetical protein n=1 Tax=Bacillus sp. ISL-34 TaxID=2819121 RepID=UPI001BEB56B6|nr:hypothetical protein [Bacillus sp. ISL-34]MBT2647897.1 hypothetical protein [Bacillus sp. ISL-34]